MAPSNNPPNPDEIHEFLEQIKDHRGRWVRGNSESATPRRVPSPHYSSQAGSEGSYEHSQASGSYTTDVGSQYTSITVPSNGHYVGYMGTHQQDDFDDFDGLIDFDLLPCEFAGYYGCERTFDVNEEERWMKHIRGHLKDLDEFPARCVCWFCDKEFGSDHTPKSERKRNFSKRLHHIRKHFQAEENRTKTLGKMLQEIRPDYFLTTYLYENGLIDRDTFDHATSYREAPLMKNAAIDWEPEERVASREKKELVAVDQEKQDRRRAREDKNSKGKSKVDKKSYGGHKRKS